MKILLLPPYFYPDEPIGAARWNRMSKYFARDGHEIFVIASNLLSNGETSELCKKIIRVDYQSSFVDRAILKAGKSKKGLKVEKERQSLQKGKKFSLLSIYSRLVDSLGKLARFPSVYWWSASRIAKEGIELIESEKIDIIIGSHPFAVSLKAASILSDRTGIPWVADMRDGWSSYYFGEYKYGTLYYKMLLKIEHKYLSKASKVVTVNEKLASTLVVKRENILVIPNVYDPEEVQPYEGSSQDSPLVKFAFAGAVHENHCWDIFFEGLADVLKVNYQNLVCIDYYGGYYELLNTKREKYDIPDGVLINHGYVEKHELIQEYAKADILLVFGFNGSFGDTVTTGKIFDYIETGKPVLAIGPKTSELAALIEATGVGTVKSSVEDVSVMVRSLMEDKNKLLDDINSLRKEDELISYSASKLSIEYSQMLEDILNRQKND